MIQNQKIENGKQSVSEKNQSLKEAFEAEKEAKIELTRTVNLKYKSCCGCGCSWIDIQRVVPFDSPLQDGYRVTEYVRGDKTL